MPYISKNVWCQAHYIQQHHQEEREGIFGGLFFVFSVYIYSWNSLWKCLWRLHILRDSCFFVAGDDEYNVFMMLKIRADLKFYKGKGWESRLGSVSCRAHPVSNRYTLEGQKCEKTRFQPMQDRDCFVCSSQGFIRVLWEQRNAVGFGHQNPSNSRHIWMLTACNSSPLGAPWGALKPLPADEQSSWWPTGRVAAGNVTESEAFITAPPAWKQGSF